jgi:hypothetical protein
MCWLIGNRSWYKCDLPGCFFTFDAGWLADAFASDAGIALLAAMAAACCLSELIG